MKLKIAGNYYNVKINLKKISFKFIIIKLIILSIGITLVKALKMYGDVDVIYIDIFLPALIFCTICAMLYTKEVHLKYFHWMFFTLFTALIVYFFAYKQMTVNNMKFFLTGQFICSTSIMLTIFQLYKLGKHYYRIYFPKKEEEEY